MRQNGAVENAVDYYSYGKMMPARNTFATNYEGYRYQFTGHEKDGETSYQYHGARYYDEDLARYMSVDPWADKYMGWSTYNYCMGNPVIFTDPTGKGVEGDFYTSAGKWLGSDGKKDDKAYVVEEKNIVKGKDGVIDTEKTKGKTELPIGNTELLDRANWVHGESGGSNEKITADERVQNIGDASKTSDARVVDYYAHAINNGAIKSGGFYKGLSVYMSKRVNGKTQNTSEGYFTGDGIGGNDNSKAFANAREAGIPTLMSLKDAKNSISAVISSVNGGVDPTGGCRVWVANPIYNNASNHKPEAGFQFSFTSGGGKYNHSFWRK